MPGSPESEAEEVLLVAIDSLLNEKTLHPKTKIAIKITFFSIAQYFRGLYKEVIFGAFKVCPFLL
jgi:hypothetical protein